MRQVLVKLAKERANGGWRCAVSDRNGGEWAVTFSDDPITAVNLAVPYMLDELVEPPTEEPLP